MRRILPILIAALVSVASTACSSGSETPTASTEASPTFGFATALIETNDGPVLLQVEVADKPELRSIGLMGRKELPPDHGMIFLYFEDTQSSFYMKNTLIPLSIAFFDVEGNIVEILDMEPCTADPCELYTPTHSYRGALEVPQGSFETWGVSKGDRIRVVQ